jgi:hypothetical protein
VTQRFSIPHVAAWAYAFILIAVSRYWTARAPGVADAELFAYIGREWARGVIPYRQLWDNKPPGIFLVNAFAALSNHQFLVLALLEFVAFFATVILISAILSKLDCRRFAWVAPITAASILTLPDYSRGGNLTEIYILPFAAGCVYSFLRAIEGNRSATPWLLIAGASAGVASAFKPVGIAPLLAIAVSLLVQPCKSLLSRLADLLFTWIGFFFVWACIMPYFIAHGAARELIQATLFYNLRYATATRPSTAMFIHLMGERLSPLAPLLGCAGICLFLGLQKQRDSSGHVLFTPKQHNAAVMLFLWLAADVGGAIAGGRYYPHYFLPMLASLTVIGCVGVDVLARIPSQIKDAQIVVCALLIRIVIIGVKGQEDAYRNVRDYLSAISSGEEEWVQAGVFIRNHQRPSDTMFIWAFRPGTYRIAGSHTVTRWASAQYLRDFPGAQASIGDELLRQLRAEPPNFVVWPCSLPVASDPITNQFVDFVRSQYQLVYKTGETCVSYRP